MVRTFTDHLGVLWGFLTALVVVLALTPTVGRVGRLVGVVDRPDQARKLHRRPIPRLGGVALFLAIIVSSLAFLRLDEPSRAILLGAAVATVVGLIDDFHGLRWWLKLAGQVGAAAIPVGWGVMIGRFNLPFLGVVSHFPTWLAAPATLVWIVALMNMVNFVDGMDGLAAGIAGIAAATCCVLALSLDKPAAAVLSAIVAGACAGFLRHNFYPARIFMGDSGAMLLGFLLATVTVQGLLKTAATVSLFFPFLVLAVPILDTSFVVLKRLKYRQPIYQADANHLHHRFATIGFSQRRAVIYLWSWCTLLAADALATKFVPMRAHGHWHLEPTLIVAALAALSLAASLYVVWLLEILTLRRMRTWITRARPAERQRARQSA